jgi:hypothetical protein
VAPRRNVTRLITRARPTRNMMRISYRVLAVRSGFVRMRDNKIGIRSRAPTAAPVILIYSFFFNIRAFE